LDFATIAFNDQFDTVLDVGCQLGMITQTPVTLSKMHKKKEKGIYHTLILGTSTNKKVISPMLGLEVSFSEQVPNIHKHVHL
jgi:hypothetical protein